MSNFIAEKFTGNAIDDAPLVVYDAAKNRYMLTLGRINKGEQELSTKISILTDSDTGAYPKIAIDLLMGKKSGRLFQQLIHKLKKQRRL